MGTRTTHYTLDIAMDAEEVIASAGVSISDKLKDMGIDDPAGCNYAFAADAIRNLIDLAMMGELDIDPETAEMFVLNALDLIWVGIAAD